MKRLSILALGLFLVTSVSAIDIESVNTFPDNVEHNTDVYVEAEITGAEDVWYEVNGQNSGTLTDRNNDNYYVSPVSFQAEGGESYTVTVHAGDSDQVVEEQVTVDTQCKVGILGTCFL